jgi:nucleoside-diphosphate-sugar epimerase
MERGDELPVNLGNPNEVTVLELAQVILRLAHSKSRIVHVELPVDDPKRRRPDITHARSMLGWEPEVPLEDGLSRTLEYFRTVV